MLSREIGFHISRHDYLQYINQCYSAVMVVNDSECVVSANPIFLNATGYTMEELSGITLNRIVPKFKFLSQWAEEYAEHIKSNQDLPQVHILLKNNRQVCSDYSLITLQTEEGMWYSVVFHELNLCHGLSLLQQFSGSFLRDVNLGVILINTEFNLVDISDMACRVLGVVREKVMGRSMEEVFSSVPLEHRLVQRTILDGLIVRNHAISWMNNQERYELLMDSNLLKDYQGNLVGAYVIFKDVSNLRSLEEQVQRSDRLAMIGQIAAGTAHEIRNPLTSIKGFLQVLKKTLRNNGMEKEYTYTEIMLTEIDRINDLVSEFLFLSKPKNVTFDVVGISTVIREILPIINNEAILHSVTVQYQPASERTEVVADRELLKQVCLNICKNGIEAMVDGGILTIVEKVDCEEQKVNVDIHDTGPGIPSFLIDKIFDPFFTTKENGTGLGLSVCQRIIHDVGGTIRVSSKGYGTTFTISIPFSKN